MCSQNYEFLAIQTLHLNSDFIPRNSDFIPQFRLYTSLYLNSDVIPQFRLYTSIQTLYLNSDFIPQFRLYTSIQTLYLNSDFIPRYTSQFRLYTSQFRLYTSIKTLYLAIHTLHLAIHPFLMEKKHECVLRITSLSQFRIFYSVAETGFHKSSATAAEEKVETYHQVTI